MSNIDTIREDIAKLMAQVEASKSAAANETDDVKVAKAILAAAKNLDNAISYGGVWENHRDEDTRKQLAAVKTAATKLRTVAEMVADVQVFDKAEGNTLAGRLKLVAPIVEAGYLPAELGAEAKAAVDAWSTVKGSGGGGPRASKGAGSLGYQLMTRHASWDKALSDSTGKGAAMSSALGKLGKTVEPNVSGASKDKWHAAGHGETYDNLAKCLDEVIAGADGAEYGEWTVEAEGRTAQAAQEAA